MQTKKRNYGDLKFYYWIHVNRQRSLWNEPCAYETFVWRVRKGMNLHDAIYYPKANYKKRRKYEPTSEDNYRRRQKLNEENVMILDFDEMEKLEILPPKPNPMAKNKYNMKPKKSLWIRFLSLFKK